MTGAPPHSSPLRWDLFCRVIDNFGDIGVCWRLAHDLAVRGHAVRLWVDDASALDWMAPDHARTSAVEVRAWTDAPDDFIARDVVIEAFGCELDEGVQARIAAAPRPPVWINLEYLSAEAFVARQHGLPSPVMSGPARGLTKHFFHPGFTADTGGLLREPGLLERRARFDRAAWFAAQGIAWQGQPVASLFSYEPDALPEWLDQLARRGALLLVTPGRASAAVRAASHRGAHLPSVHWLTPFPQAGFDELLWACDFNAVRGEDSLVRAVWAGRPFAWQLYPQHDGAHGPKLEAFLDWLEAPPVVRGFHRRWNGDSTAALPDVFDANVHAHWQACATRAASKAATPPDLTEALIQFVNRAGAIRRNGVDTASQPFSR